MSQGLDDQAGSPDADNGFGQDVLIELRLDEQTWRSGTPARQAEWHLCLDEVLAEGIFGDGAGPELRKKQKGLLTVLPTAIELTLSSDGAAPDVQRIPVQALRPLMGEYMETIRSMARLPHGQNSPQLEALDIAKRITHDEAGELVQSMLPSLRPSHGTARRIFTLLVTIFHDTTRIAVAHPIRPR
jgi:uncharacterized protein (UPF0262 family)